MMETTTKFWGRWCGFDMQDCDLQVISDRAAIARYIEEVCDLLRFQRYAEPNIVRFGQRPEIAGYTFTQMIETSLLAGHLVESTRCAFIDIFSCSAYPADMAEAFTRRFFGAGHTVSHHLDRYGGNCRIERR